MTENPLNEPMDETTAEVISIALQFIPVVGPLMSSTAMFFLDREKNVRLNRFLIQLSKDMAENTERINQEFIQKEEFRDLVENIFSKAAETRQQEKLDAFRAIFINSIICTSVYYPTIEEITDLIQSWQSLHIRLLKILYDPHDVVEKGGLSTTIEGNQWTVIGFFSRYMPDLNPETLKRIWTRLYNDGVIDTDYQPNKSIFFGRGVNTGFLTRFGREIVSLLQN